MDHHLIPLLPLLNHQVLLKLSHKLLVLLFLHLLLLRKDAVLHPAVDMEDVKIINAFVTHFTTDLNVSTNTVPEIVRIEVIAMEPRVNVHVIIHIMVAIAVLSY